MFVQGQNFVKKALLKCFPADDFSWIDDIFPDEEDEDGWDMEGIIKDNPPDLASTAIASDEPVTEVRAEMTNNVPPAL